MEKVINLSPDYQSTLDSLEIKTIQDKLSGGPK